MNKRLQGYSLVEMLVSMAIIAIIVVMLSTVLTTTIRVARKSAARSFTREEISLIADLIVSDVRSATSVNSCSGEGVDAECEIVVEGILFRWRLCDDDPEAICKYDSSDTQILKNSGSVNITALTFEEGLDTGTDIARRNILLTIVGDHVNPAYEVTNMIRQTAASTRNYTLRGGGSL